MSTVGPLLAGIACGLVVLHLLRPVLASPVLQRTNYRGRMLSTAGGLAGGLDCASAGRIITDASSPPISSLLFM